MLFCESNELIVIVLKKLIKKNILKNAMYFSQAFLYKYLYLHFIYLIFFNFKYLNCMRFKKKIKLKFI